jgi:mannose-6-phosphate isomerase-like protein (cupin superfamily)
VKKKVLRFKERFRIAINTKNSQVAEMVLSPGEKEGGPDNRHKGANQWLFVVKGHGYARVNGRKFKLEPGSLLLIEKGDFHEVGNDSKKRLQTLNIYAPPAYKKSGDPLPSGRKN